MFQTTKSFLIILFAYWILFASSVMAEDDLLRQDYDGALIRLDEYDGKYGDDSELEDEMAVSLKLRFRALQGVLSEVRVPGGVLPGDVVANIEKMKSTHDRLLQILARDQERYIREGFEYRSFQSVAWQQKLSVQMSDTLRRFRHYEGAIEALEAASRRFSLALAGLNHEISHTEVTAEGSVQKMLPRWKIFGMQSNEELTRGQISILQLWYNDLKKDDIKNRLVEKLTQFTEEYPGSAWTGVYTSSLMELSDSFDLDQLIKAYGECEDKTDPQYVYSSLGLANRLLSKKRAAEALPILEYIKERGIDKSRNEELHYQLGVTHMQLGNKKEALAYFLAVKKIGDRFKSVDVLIEMLNPRMVNAKLNQETKGRQTLKKDGRPVNVDQGDNRLWWLVGVNGFLVCFFVGIWLSRRMAAKK